jgi:hypothetical protein
MDLNNINIGPPGIEDRTKRQEYLIRTGMKEFYDEISDKYTAVHEPEMDTKMENILKALNMKRGLN